MLSAGLTAFSLPPVSSRFEFTLSSLATHSRGCSVKPFFRSSSLNYMSFSFSTASLVLIEMVTRPGVFLYH